MLKKFHEIIIAPSIKQAKDVLKMRRKIPEEVKTFLYLIIDLFQPYLGNNPFLLRFSWIHSMEDGVQSMTVQFEKNIELPPQRDSRIH